MASLFFVLGLLSVFSLLTTCTAKPAEKSETIRIGIAFSQLDHDIWTYDMAVMEEIAKTEGVEVLKAVAEMDMSRQTQQIEDFIAQGVNAIICAAVDTTAIKESVARCNEAGIPFIYNLREVSGSASAKVAYGAGANSTKMAELATQWLADYARKNNTKLNILELLGDLADSFAIGSTAGVKNIVDANSDVLQITQQVPTEWKAEKANAGVINAVQADSRINCIFVHSDALLPAVITALKQMGKYQPSAEQGHIVIAVLGGEGATLDVIKEGYVDVLSTTPIPPIARESMKNAIILSRGGTVTQENESLAGTVIDSVNFDQTAKEAFGFESMKK
jgi:ABC-type sugar transport system substrate-binding protein